MSLQPIIAATCMACTIPFNNSSTTYEKNDEPNQDIVIYKRKDNMYVVHAKNTTTLSARTLYNMNTNNYTSSPVSNYRPMKVSRKNRKNHNIHQPGRTNCTQRYQK